MKRSLFALAVCILVVFCSGPVQLAAPTSFSVGPNFPASGTNDASSGTYPWGGAGNITAEDGVTASTGELRFFVDTYYLKGTQFGFNIPNTATINGIKLEIKIMDASNPNGDDICSDSVVSLVKAGTVQGANRGGHGLSTTALTWEVYGGPTDLWGLSWTPSDINSSAFGGVLQAHLEGSAGINFARCIVDAYRITVYYTN